MRAGYKPGADVAIALDPASSEFYGDGGVRICPLGQAQAQFRRDGRLLCATGRYAIRSSRSRTASPKTIGPDGKRSRANSANDVQLVGDDLFVTNPKRLARGIARARRQFDPDQGQPDRHADRNLEADRGRARRRLHLGHFASLGRNRRHHHRRPRGRDRRRPDQDRFDEPRRTHRQIQPPDSHRRGVGLGRASYPGARRFKARCGCLR